MLQRWFLLFVLTVAPAGAQTVTARAARSLGASVASEVRVFNDVQVPRARTSAREDTDAPGDRVLLVLEGSEWLVVVVARQPCDSAISKVTLGAPFSAPRVRIIVRF